MNVGEVHDLNLKHLKLRDHLVSLIHHKDLEIRGEHYVNPEVFGVGYTGDLHMSLGHVQDLQHLDLLSHIITPLLVLAVLLGSTSVLRLVLKHLESHGGVKVVKNVWIVRPKMHLFGSPSAVDVVHTVLNETLHVVSQEVVLRQMLNSELERLSEESLLVSTFPLSLETSSLRVDLVQL